MPEKKTILKFLCSVSSQFQIVIPVVLRNKLEINKNDVVEFRWCEGKVSFRKNSEESNKKTRQYNTLTLMEEELDKPKK